MKVISNFLWLVFGGFASSIGYFTASLSLAITIIGLPWALQTFKLGILCLWPFGSTVTKSDTPSGCITLPLNIIWLIFGGLLSFISHIVSGLLLCVTIIGIPWGKQHFKMAGLSLAPFGKKVNVSI